MHPRALVEGQLAQRRAADLAGVVEHAAEIEPAAEPVIGDRRAVDRARDLGEAAVAGDPAVAGVIEQLESLHRAP
jgi:hypothetical protein